MPLVHLRDYILNQKLLKKFSNRKYYISTEQKQEHKMCENKTKCSHAYLNISKGSKTASGKCGQDEAANLNC